MSDNTTILGKEVIIGGAEHLRDEDLIERLCEGRMFVGDSVNKGTLETQCVATEEADTAFLGIVLGHSIRQTDTETVGVAGVKRDDGNDIGLLVAGKMVRILKPTGGRIRVRCMIGGFDGGATVATGSPVYSNSVGSTIAAAQATQLGDFYADPAQEGANSHIVGRLALPSVLATTATNNVNTVSEMWY